MDPWDRDEELAECIRSWPGMDLDRWWAMSEHARAWHMAQYRLKGQRESLLAKVREEVDKQFKDDSGGGGVVEGFMGGLMG